MSLEKAKIGDAIYDVISVEEYYQNPNSYSQYTAIKGEDGIIYPIRTKTDSRPGFYPTGGMDFFSKPCETDMPIYNQDNIINFHDAANLREVILAQQELNKQERSILMTIDSVFAPEIGADDTPEMKALKQAIIDKHIDLDKYEPRFGPNYNNDKRLLKKDSITFGKLRAICQALDIKATITIEDASSDVPNPIGRVITTELTGSSASVEEEGE